MAFIDTQMYIHTLVSIKNLIIAADLSKSITLLRLQVRFLHLTIFIISLMRMRKWDIGISINERIRADSS